MAGLEALPGQLAALRPADPTPYVLEWANAVRASAERELVGGDGALAQTADSESDVALVGASCSAPAGFGGGNDRGIGGYGRRFQSDGDGTVLKNVDLRLEEMRRHMLALRKEVRTLSDGVRRSNALVEWAPEVDDVLRRAENVVEGGVS